jgi:hypothetical protein
MKYLLDSEPAPPGLRERAGGSCAVFAEIKVDLSAAICQIIDRQCPKPAEPGGHCARCVILLRLNRRVHTTNIFTRQVNLATRR